MTGAEIYLLAVIAVLLAAILVKLIAVDKKLTGRLRVSDQPSGPLPSEDKDVKIQEEPQGDPPPKEDPDKPK